MQQAGTAVGDADRVIVLKDAGDRAVVVGAERHRDSRIAVGGEDLQPAGRLGRVRPDVGVPADLGALVEQVAAGGRGLQPDLVRERAAVWVGVYRDHTVTAQRR